MYMRGMGDSSNPAATDYTVPLIDVVAPTPDQLAITDAYPVVTSQTPSVGDFMTTYVDVPVIGRFTPKQMLIWGGAAILLYVLLTRRK